MNENPSDESGPSYLGYVLPGTTFQTARDHVSLFRIVPCRSLQSSALVSPYRTKAPAIDHERGVAQFRNTWFQDMACRVADAPNGAT